MPTYSIEGPDGKTYSIDGPAGATRDQVIEQIQKQLQTSRPNAQPNATPPQQAKEPGPEASYTGELAKGAARGPVGFGGFVLGGLQDIVTARGLREGAANVGRYFRGEEPKFEPHTYGEQAIEKLGIEPSENATTGQAVAGSVAESLTNPMSWIGPEGLIVKTLSAIGAGAGSELVGELGEQFSPELGTVGRIIGGAAGGTVPGSAVKSRTHQETIKDTRVRLTDTKKLYDEEQIKAQADKGYNWLRAPANTVQITPQGIERMYQRVIAELDASGADRVTARRTYEMLDNNLRPGNLALGDSADVLGLHNKLGKITETPEAMDDPRAAQIARRVVREELENNLPTGAGNKLKKAMGDWSHYEMIQDVRKSLETAIHRAQTSGTNKNSINTMRQQIRKILDSDKRVRGFPKEARDGMETIISGTMLENFSRLIGKAVPYSSGFAIISTLAQSKMAFPLAAVAGVSWGARKLGDFLTRAQIEQLVTILRQQAPSNKYRMGQNRPLLRQVEPYPRVGAVRGALVGATPTGEPGSDTGEALAGDIGNFAQGGLYGVAKGRGLDPGPLADSVAQLVQSRGMSDAMVGMAIPTNVLHDLLVVQKMTYEQAAKALGVTRQAVAGKAFREGLASGRKQGQQTAEGVERLRASGRVHGGRTGPTPGAPKLTNEQRELQARIQRVHDALSRARPGERPQPSLPKLKFMEGPGPDEVPGAIPRIIVHPREDGDVSDALDQANPAGQALE